MPKQRVSRVRDRRRVPPSPKANVPGDFDWQYDWNPKQLEKVEGFLWPPIAVQYRERYHRHAPDIDVALRFTPLPRVVVQAGGNVGVWADYLRTRFENVYTFEPDAMNFYCLARNVWQPNVHKFQAALGAPGHAPVGINFHAGNIGAHNVLGPGAVPVMTIDQLNLPVCDLIILDVEGYEFPALKGAREVLEGRRPAVMIENRGHGEKMGYGSFEEICAWMAELDYVVADTVAKDVIFAPKERV